ncbi:MAG TPA: tetratricopeptide repeat protein, partial [Candidatus Goldiibacteriota bacterium]|nr:tetratricopeptide repeat protein [Candidatus Goldiibacteriota bacterium]
MKKFFFIPLVILLLANQSVSEDNKYYSDNVENSIEYYEKEITKNKNNVMNYFNLASVYKEFGENRGAINLYLDLLKINDRDPRVHFEIAKMHYFLGEYNSAEEEINFFMIGNIVNWEIYYYLGCILMEQGKFNEAKEAFLKSVELDDKKVVTFIKLAELYQNTNEYSEAIKNYKMPKNYNLNDERQGFLISGVCSTLSARLATIGALWESNKAMCFFPKEPN